MNIPDVTLNDDTFLDQIKAPWMGEGEWILIKSEMSTEDSINIDNKLGKLKQHGKQTEITLSLGDVKLAKVECMVKGWNLFRMMPNGQKRPIPFSVQMVRKLPKRYFDFISDEINKRNEEPQKDGQEQEQEQERFLPSVVDSTEGNLNEEISYLPK